MSKRPHSPGPWELWTGCSWRRIGIKGTSKTICEPVVAPDGHPDLLFRNGGQDGPDANLLVQAWTIPALQRERDEAVGLLKRFMDYAQLTAQCRAIMDDGASATRDARAFLDRMKP